VFQSHKNKLEKLFYTGLHTEYISAMSRQEYNIKMDLQETQCEGVDNIQQTQDRVQWRSIMNM